MKKAHISVRPDSVKMFEREWPIMTEALSLAFRMTEEEREKLSELPIARLIGAIPFLAECENPERTAVAHLGTYLLSVRETKPYFNANENDDRDILDRLHLIMQFDGGRREIIDRGMALIALSMITDYQRDIQIDAATGKYNPVTSGSFSYETVSPELVRKIEEVECPGMDAILSAGDVGTRGLWHY